MHAHQVPARSLLDVLYAYAQQGRLLLPRDSYLCPLVLRTAIESASILGRACADIMRLLKCLTAGGDFELTSFSDDLAPPYAILSHTWTEGQEVTYNELVAGTGKDKTGYDKICFCSNRAAADSLEYFWVDTCCIDKSTSAELSTAINSMFRWYQRASKCYVYLSDVSVPEEVIDAEAFPVAWREAFRRSRWFTRGWTLQELLAPANVEFFCKQGKRLGSRVSLEREIHDITKIPLAALRGQSLSEYSVDERLDWATRRTTTLKEDKVYCLLGIFGVFLPLIYGEGEAYAILRLREEIQRRQQEPHGTDTSNNVALDTPPRQTTAQENMEYERFLRSISYPEMEYRFHNIDDVEHDTCGWLLNHSHYQKWRSRPGSSHFLMIRGKPGSGKSTAMKRAYKLAEERASANEAIIAFFFNSRGVSMETKLEGFFRSTLHQLLKRHGSTKDDAFIEWKQKYSLIKSGWAWTVKELQSMFVKYAVRSTVKITMFVDALDECESPSDARKLMGLFNNTDHDQEAGQPRLKICISSRHYPNVGVDEPLQIIVEKTNQGDITQCVKMALQRLQIDLSDDLSTEITSRSNGMFLWAFLVIEKIREALDDREPREELKAIINRTPPRLEEVFKGLIDGIPVNERERSNRILSWILFTKRPLSLTELYHALAFGSEDKYQTYSDYETSNGFIRPEQMKTLLAKYTRGLVEAVEIEEWGYLGSPSASTVRVQFIHESVRQYMLSDQGVIISGSDAKWSNLGFVNDFLARSCFNYIRAVCVELRSINDIVKKLETRRFYPGQLYKYHTKDQPFLEYAIQFGFAHAKTADLNGLPPSYLFPSTIDNVAGKASWWITFTSVFRLYWKRGGHGSYGSVIEHWSECATTQIAFACAYQLDSWVNHLLGNNQPDLDKTDLSKALCVAVSMGNQKSIALLIEAGADVDYEDLTLGSPLCLSLLIGRDDIVAILLDHKATIRMGSRKRSALVAAVLYRPVKIVRLLLDGGAEIAECESPGTLCRPWFLGKHALEAAIQRDFEVLEALLSHAERQRVPVEYYKAAYLSAAYHPKRGFAQTRRKEPHAGSLESVVTKLFPGNPMISININTLRSKSSRLNVWEDTQISILKEVLERVEGPPADQIMLAHGSRILHEHQTVRDYGVQQGSTIHMLRRARWGGRVYGG